MLQHKGLFTLLFLFLLTFTGQAQIELDFSNERGFYDGPIDLNITSSDPSSTIRYTLNGDEPSTTYGEIYDGGIPITTTAVIRAISYVDGIDTSMIYTHSYLFLEDVVQQPKNIAGWPNNSYNLGSGGMAEHDYEMDPSIVSSPDYSADIINGLKDIPSLSIVMPKDDFWDMYDGSSEKKTSVELLYADDSSMNEQVDGGIEPHSHNRLKRSMRLSFKKQYGKANWESNIFRNAAIGSDSAVDEFDRIVLRGGNNRAWSRNWNEDRTAFTRDEWFRQSQIAASGIGSHGTFVHLYVNGLYWGLYNPVERPDEGFTSSYLGGEKEDWFAVSHGGEQGGNEMRFDYLEETILANDLSETSNYNEFKEYMDVDKFQDYVLLSWMTGVQDWPGNNWWGGNQNEPTEPFMYFGWDNEWSWDVTKNANNGAWVHPEFRSNKLAGKNSALVFNKAKFNQEFMMAFADRVYKLCFNNGVMTDANSRLRWTTLNHEIEDAVIAESARWGDGLNDGTTRTRDVHWRNEVDRLDGLMNGNVERLITALLAENYYPSIDPPLFENNSDAIEVQELSVPNNYLISLINTNSGGEIYYTLDGTDPRLAGGGIAPSAIAYTNGDVKVDQSLRLLARVKNGAEWSALHCLNLVIQSDLSMVKLTEIMYHPSDFGEIEGSELEFLEIKNTSTDLSADLSGVSISDGVDFTFPLGTILEPQAFIVLASDSAALLSKCPEVHIFGEYDGQLSNGGEEVEFMSFDGDLLISVEYDDKLPWPVEADGEGYSLVASMLNPTGNQNTSEEWDLSSDSICGSPGVDDVLISSLEPSIETMLTGLYPNPVLRNSVITVESEKQIESVSLYNTIGQEVLLLMVSNQGKEVMVKSPTSPGLYMLRINYQNGVFTNKSLIVN